MLYSCDPSLTPSARPDLASQKFHGLRLFHGPGCGDSSAGKGLAWQAQGPESDILEPTVGKKEEEFKEEESQLPTLEVWRNGTVVKGTYCSCKSLGLGFQHPYLVT